MKKVYHLSTCSTCKRILKEVAPLGDFIQQDIKNDAITEAQLDEMKNLIGSYETLFSRRSRKYGEMGLAGKALTEEEIKQLILQEYTFLKRPVFIVDEKIFVGNSKKTVDALKKELEKSE
jgi:arsenate reductase-like glutaredoxin family protein